MGRTYDMWCAEAERWNGAEEEAIIQEERLRIRLRPLSQTCREVAWAFREVKEGRDQAPDIPVDTVDSEEHEEGKGEM